MYHHRCKPPPSPPLTAILVTTTTTSTPSPLHTTNIETYITTNTAVTSKHHQHRGLHHRCHLLTLPKSWSTSPPSPPLGQIGTKTKWIRNEHRGHEQRTTKRIALQRTDTFRINIPCRRRYSGNRNRASTTGRKKPPSREPTQKVMWMVGPSSHHQTTLSTS